jgi:hypothetical protein
MTFTFLPDAYDAGTSPTAASALPVVHKSTQTSVPKSELMNPSHLLHLPISNNQFPPGCPVMFTRSNDHVIFGIVLAIVIDLSPGSTRENLCLVRQTNGGSAGVQDWYVMEAALQYKPACSVWIQPCSGSSAKEPAVVLASYDTVPFSTAMVYSVHMTETMIVTHCVDLKALSFRPTKESQQAHEQVKVSSTVDEPQQDQQAFVETVLCQEETTRKNEVRVKDEPKEHVMEQLQEWQVHDHHVLVKHEFFGILEPSAETHGQCEAEVSVMTKAEATLERMEDPPPPKDDTFTEMHEHQSKVTSISSADLLDADQQLLKGATSHLLVITPCAHQDNTDPQEDRPRLAGTQQTYYTAQDSSATSPWRFDYFIALPDWINVQMVDDVLDDLTIQEIKCYTGCSEIRIVRPGQTSVPAVCPCQESLHIHLQSANEGPVLSAGAQIVEDLLSSMDYEQGCGSNF